MKCFNIVALISLQSIFNPIESFYTKTTQQESLMKPPKIGGIESVFFYNQKMIEFILGDFTCVNTLCRDNSKGPR